MKTAPDPLLWATWREPAPVGRRPCAAGFRSHPQDRLRTVPAGPDPLSAGGGTREARDAAPALKEAAQGGRRDVHEARRQVAFIRRMRAGRGALWMPNGKPSRRLLSLVLWGHDPDGSAAVLAAMNPGETL